MQYYVFAQFSGESYKLMTVRVDWTMSQFDTRSKWFHIMYQSVITYPPSMQTEIQSKIDEPIRPPKLGGTLHRRLPASHQDYCAE
jgi:hypothetical protein